MKLDVFFPAHLLLVREIILDNCPFFVGLHLIILEPSWACLRSLSSTAKTDVLFKSLLFVKCAGGQVGLRRNGQLSSAPPPVLTFLINALSRASKFLHPLPRRKRETIPSQEDPFCAESCHTILSPSTSHHTRDGE